MVKISKPSAPAEIQNPLAESPLSGQQAQAPRPEQTSALAFRRLATGIASRIRLV